MSDKSRGVPMRRYPLVTPAQRDHLLRLKTEFDAACAAVDDFSDRDSLSFRTAQDLYRTWIKAIDAAALWLLSDLNALEAAASGSNAAEAPPDAQVPVEKIRPGEVDHVFAEIDDMLHAQAIVTEDDDEMVDLFGR